MSSSATSTSRGSDERLDIQGPTDNFNLIFYLRCAIFIFKQGTCEKHDLMQRHTFPLVALLTLWTLSACKGADKDGDSGNKEPAATVSGSRVESNPPRRDVKSSFLLKELPDEEGMPRTSVSVRIGETDYRIADVNGRATLTERDKYASMGIPGQAIAACESWWAGSGDYFYLSPEGGATALYQGWLDESQEDEGYHWKKVRSW